MDEDIPIASTSQLFNLTSVFSPDESKPKKRPAKPREPRKPRRKVCQACQARKVKCLGLDEPGAVACDACAIHGIVCSGWEGTVKATSIQQVEGTALAARHKAAFKPRVGSKIGQLQRLAEAQLAEHNLSTRTATARLVYDELGGALTWALINSAFEATSVQSLSPLTSLHVVRDDFRKGGMRTYALAVEQEILLACYIAIGSRRSNHSAIVGPVSNNTSLVSLGAKREAACRSLVERAVNLLQTSSVITEPSMDNIEIVTAVKESIMVVHPTHPFSKQISPILHAHRMHLDRQGRKLSMAEEMRTGFALYDARVSARNGERPYLGERDLDIYLFGEMSWAESIASLSNPDEPLPSGLHLTGWNLHVQFGVLRRVAAVFEEAATAPNNAFASLNSLWRMVDLTITYVKTKLDQIPVTPSPSPPSDDGSSSPEAASPASSVGKGDLPYSQPTRIEIAGEVPDIILTETHLANLAFRISREHRPTGKLWRNVETTASIRFLKALRWLTDVFSDQKFTRAADVHWVARRLDTLEVLPSWSEIALEGVKQNARGEGPLLAAGYSLQDLKRLLEHLESSSMVYASSFLRAEEIRAGLEQSGLLEPKFEELSPQEDIAATIVSGALQEMSLD
ncbi:hypothetical protein T439DRAFT_381368 [Meredithblackwellia eburnea MCA 4105]